MGKVTTEMGMITWMSFTEKMCYLEKCWDLKQSASRWRLDWFVLVECGDNADWVKHCVKFDMVELDRWDISGTEQRQDENFWLIPKECRLW